jgi:D-sedoheptulose 7-phosphate isomerase
MDHSLKKYINDQVKKSYEVKQAIYADEKLMQSIQDVCLKVVDVYKQNRKTLIAGNGGSAADAQHIAGEFVSKFYFDRPGLASLALTTDTSILTAIGNDYGYDKLFSRQVQANGVEGDIFIGLSTSGNSQNIIEALLECKEKGIITVGVTGKDGGLMKDLCDYCICVPSQETPRIQESHILIGHIICAVVEEAIFGKGFY